MNTKVSTSFFCCQSPFDSLCGSPSAQDSNFIPIDSLLSLDLQGGKWHPPQSITDIFKTHRGSPEISSFEFPYQPNWLLKESCPEFVLLLTTTSECGNSCAASEAATPCGWFRVNYGCLRSIEAAILKVSTKNKACRTSERLVDIHPKKQFLQPWGSSPSFPLGTPCTEPW